MSWQKPSEIFSLRLIDIVTAVCILLSCILLNDFNFAQQKISDIQDGTVLLRYTVIDPEPSFLFFYNQLYLDDCRFKQHKVC